LKFRKFIFWLHLTVGVCAGTIVFLMSFTGVALMYQKQITEWADRSYWPVPSPSPQQNPLPIAELISKAAEAQPDGTPTAITIYSAPQSPAVVANQPGQNVFIDRYTGAATVGGSTAVRTFFRSVTDLHRYLAMSGENRPTGRAITDACNLAFLFIVCSGFYLWWPRNWTFQAVRPVTWFRKGLTGKSRDFNWHNVFGFWAAIPLFFIVLSGVVMSYPWANSTLYRIAGSPEPVRNGGQRGAQERGRNDRGRDGREQAGRDMAQLDGLLSVAEQQSPGWRTINLRLPADGENQVTFSVDKSIGGRPQMRSTIVFDRRTSRITRTQTFSDQTAGERARSWMRFVHTGEYYGIAGQTIAGIASAAGGMLVFTGLSLAVRRLFGWNSRRRRMSVPFGAESLQEE
jgi:uncharacterized iron-regulated membrane protein